MFDQFTHLVAESSGWAYLVILVFAAVDAVVPIVPSEAAVITAGVVAVSGDLFLPAVIAAAAAGAFGGDNLAYSIGRRYGGALTERFFRGGKSRRRIEWAKRTLNQRGGELITVARFIPGGRTAVTLTAGLSRFAWPRFALFDAIAATVWAGYAAFLGYLGGRAFEHQAWKGLLLAFAIALTVAVSTELVRWIVSHTKQQRTKEVQYSRPDSRRERPSSYPVEHAGRAGLIDADVDAGVGMGVAGLEGGSSDLGAPGQ